jgi:hypothetical protein
MQPGSDQLAANDHRRAPLSPSVSSVRIEDFQHPIDTRQRGEGRDPHLTLTFIPVPLRVSSLAVAPFQWWHVDVVGKKF